MKKFCGPFRKIEIKKEFNDSKDLYELKAQDIFPEKFSMNAIENNLEYKREFIDEIIKPYVKSVVFENENLMRINPVGAWISKKTTTLKLDDEIKGDLIVLLKKMIPNTDSGLIENAADYILINILKNKSFKTELISNAQNAAELQKLGRVNTGFNGLIETMIDEVAKIVSLKDFPYQEFYAMQDVFYTSVAVLKSLSVNLEGMSEEQILAIIKETNKDFNVTCNNSSKISIPEYRKNEATSDKYGSIVEFVKADDIEKSLINLCKMVVALLEKKDDISIETYIKEAMRIHYRFLRIQPFDNANEETARAMVNMILQSKEMVGVFRKEKRKEYIETIANANKVIKDNESLYLKSLSENPMKCIEIEDVFLNSELPFLLVRY